MWPQLLGAAMEYCVQRSSEHTSVRALRNNEKFSGCTVHYVSSKLDSGQIIMQKKVKILKKETKTSLDKKIIKEEHKLYPSAILRIFN